MFGLCLISIFYFTLGVLYYITNNRVIGRHGSLSSMCDLN